MGELQQENRQDKQRTNIQEYQIQEWKLRNSMLSGPGMLM